MRKILTHIYRNLDELPEDIAYCFHFARASIVTVYLGLIVSDVSCSFQVIVQKEKSYRVTTTQLSILRSSWNSISLSFNS
jgi:hypothetical protein